MNEEFDYEVRGWRINSQATADDMAADIEERFNSGWKPTTNGPAMVLPLAPGNRLWLVMYIFAREKRRHDA